MGADPHDLPSGFSVVSDSIRRDREALFGATRADVPTIADGDDSSDGSDVEVPVFFTTTGSDAETEAEGFGGALPPGLLSPKPLDFKSRAGRSRHERLGEDVSERTDRDRDREAERRTPFSSATADDEAAALAAFELAAERALRVEEARSNRLVRAHLHEARGERLDVTDDDENEPSRSDAPSASAESSSSDDETSVRARRRPPPRPRGRSAVDSRNTRRVRENTAISREDTKHEEDANGQPDAFRVRLAGAAGRLARDANEKRTRLDATSVVESPCVVMDDKDGDRSESGDVWKDAETAVEMAFAAQTRASELSELSELSNAKDSGEGLLARNSLDLGSALGGLDLDGLLRRLEAPGGEAVVASVTALRSKSSHVDLEASADESDEKTSLSFSDGGDAGESDGFSVAGASRRRDVEGWVLATAKARPQTARPAKADATGNARVTLRESLSGKGPRSVGDRTLDADPYGRGTRRGRRVARPQPASPIATPPTPADAALSPSPIEEQSRSPVPFSFTPPRAGTVRINAWDTMDASAENELGKTKRKEKQKEEEAKETKATDAAAGVSSPSALLAESASRRAADASRAAREAAARASLEADARELAARVRAAEAAAERAEAGAEMSIRKERREKTFAPAFPAAVSDAALAAADALRADGNASFRRGDVLGAVETFTEALAHVPNDVAALANRAAARLRLGEWAAAERDASACLSLDAKHEKALHRRAKARTGLGDHEGALSDLRSLSDLLPNHAETAAMLARARKAAERTAGSAAEGAARAAARMEEREESRRRAEEEEAARWEARRLAGIHAHMERAKAAVRVSRK